MYPPQERLLAQDQLHHAKGRWADSVCILPTWIAPSTTLWRLSLTHTLSVHNSTKLVCAFASTRNIRSRRELNRRWRASALVRVVTNHGYSDCSTYNLPACDTIIEDETTRPRGVKFKGVEMRVHCRGTSFVVETKIPDEAQS
jgi:hypothetical protein